MIIVGNETLHTLTPITSYLSMLTFTDTLTFNLPAMADENTSNLTGDTCVPLVATCFQYLLSVST